MHVGENSINHDPDSAVVREIASRRDVPPHSAPRSIRLATHRECTIAIHKSKSLINTPRCFRRAACDGTDDGDRESRQQPSEKCKRHPPSVGNP